MILRNSLGFKVQGLGLYGLGFRVEGSGFKVLWGVYAVDNGFLHDPQYRVPWELWYYNIRMACRMFSINSSCQKARLDLIIQDKP